MFDISKITRRGRLLTAVLLLLVSSGISALTDPTRPSAYRAAGETQSLQLESVLISRDRKIAVINGRILSEGERIDGFKVIKIAKESVKGQLDGKRVTLELGHTEIRRKN